MVFFQYYLLNRLRPFGLYPYPSSLLLVDIRMTIYVKRKKVLIFPGRVLENFGREK